MAKRAIVILADLAVIAAAAVAQATKPAPAKKAKTAKPKTGKVEGKASATIPAKAICPVTKDTWIYAFRPDSNYGGGLGWKDRTDPTKDLTVPKMFLGFGGSDKKVVLLDFDISKLPRGVKPSRAVVRLYNDFAASSAGIEVAAAVTNYTSRVALDAAPPRCPDAPQDSGKAVHRRVGTWNGAHRLICSRRLQPGRTPAVRGYAHPEGCGYSLLPHPRSFDCRKCEQHPGTAQI